jgi:hypothetical protein
MPLSLRAAACAVITFGLSATLTACGRDPNATNAVAAAPGAATSIDAPAPPPKVYSADPAKTGQAYVEELKANPALFEKQKALCNGHGAEMQPRPELEGPCWAWSKAQEDLQIEQDQRAGGVKNTSSL